MHSKTGGGGESLTTMNFVHLFNQPLYHGQNVIQGQFSSWFELEFSFS